MTATPDLSAIHAVQPYLYKQIERNDQFGLPILRPHGIVDFGRCPELLAAIQEGLQGAGRALAIDASRVTSMDLSGAILLLTVQQHLQRQGKRLIVLDPSAAVRRALHSAARPLGGA